MIDRLIINKIILNRFNITSVRLSNFRGSFFKLLEFDYRTSGVRFSVRLRFFRLLDVGFSDVKTAEKPQS